MSIDVTAATPVASPTGVLTTGQATEVSAWPLLLGRLRYAPGLFLLNAVAWMLFYPFPLANGLLARRLFDILGGAIPGSGLPGAAVLLVLVLLLAAGAGRMIAFAGALVL